MLRPRINGNIKILTAILLAGFTLFNISLISFAQYEPGLFDQPSSERQEVEKGLEKKAAEEIINVECPTGSTTFYFEEGLKKGKFFNCVAPSKTGTCENKALEYKKDGKFIGCIVKALKITRAGDIKVGDIKIEQSEIQKYTTYSKIPCQPGFGGLGGACPKAEGGPAAYIARLYQFGLMIAGLAAFGSIVYGSLKYILSAGNIGSTEEAKDIIRQAIYGLVLLLGAYLILYTINPNLVNLRNPDVSPLDIASVIKKGALPDEQRLPPSSNEEHPLCQSGVGSGLTVQSNIKFGEPLKEALGLPSEIIDFNCLKCKANAVKSSVSDCECDVGFVPNDAGNGCIRPVGVTAPALLPKQQVPIFNYQPPNYVELPKQQ